MTISTSNIELKKPGAVAYVIAGLGFIPGLGIFFAVAAFVIGCVKWKNGGKPLVVLGVLPVVGTILFYSIMIKLVFDGDGPFKNANAQVTQMQFAQLIPMIEYYKTQNGKYPAKLDDLNPKSSKVPVANIYDIYGHLNPAHPKEYFYQLTADGTHYYLRSTGPDDVPFTADDIVPTMPDDERSKMGLLIDPPSDASGISRPTQEAQ